MVSPQAASAVTVMGCAPGAAQIASVSRCTVWGERLAMRVRSRALLADPSAVGVPQRASASRSPELAAILSPVARSSVGDTANRTSLRRLTARVAFGCEVGVSAVEDPQPRQQFVAGLDPTQLVGVAAGVVG